MKVVAKIIELSQHPAALEVPIRPSHPGSKVIKGFSVFLLLNKSLGCLDMVVPKFTAVSIYAERKGDHLCICHIFIFMLDLEPKIKSTSYRHPPS